MHTCTVLIYGSQTTFHVWPLGLAPPGYENELQYVLCIVICIVYYAICIMYYDCNMYFFFN